MIKQKKVHFVGIKGVGMTALAIIAKQAGFVVSGSDIAQEFITDETLKKADIEPFVSFSKDHITSDIDLVIATGAHGGYDNVEVKTAKEKHVPVFMQGQAVGEFMKGELFGRSYIGISVTGTHGKTTTTAMIATMLANAGKDPSYIIGTSNVPSLGHPGHFGKGEHFVAEADEYATEPVYDKTPKFLWQHPKIAVFTNIEHDHPDLYPTIDDVREAFLQFANSLSKDATLIACGDDPQIQKLIKNYSGKVITYGKGKENDYVLSNVQSNNGKTLFSVFHKESHVGDFLLNISGEHNALNALSAIVVGSFIGLSKEEITKGLLAFSGSKRRFEYVGKLGTGALLYDDYAHHPTEIKKTLEAFRDAFPDKKIVCIFQPHTYSRTKSLFNEFSQSFKAADVVVLVDIYPSLREVPDPMVSSEKLAGAVRAVWQDVVYKKTLSDVTEYLTQQNFKEDTVVITMGAGDIYKIAETLV